MINSKYNWELKIPGIVKNDDIFVSLLKNRNIFDYESFFSMGEEALIDPYLLNDMVKAKSRILEAIENNELIMVYGDYDCDGICSISLLYRVLKKLGANVYYDLPNRFVDGYGLNMRAVTKIHNLGITLVITVDNGVTCVNEIEKLNNLGIDTIITDHHQFGEVIPKAFAIIHTKLSKDYSFKEICGVMVALKLSQALIGYEAASEYYDLAMIGTIADLMPLKDENQALINLGLEQLKNTKNLGLQKLIEFSNLDMINVTAIAFKLAPKINSSGRLGKALDAVKLLVTDSHKEANELIIKIEKNHTFRKKLTEESFKQCEKLVNPFDKVIVISSDKLHEGVIGICAQKIVEKYQRSSLIITVDEDGIGKGSMRSFGDENILKLLQENKQYLMRFGGHSQAAGLQLKQENIDKLRAGLNSLSNSDQAPNLEVDMKVNLHEIEIDTIQRVQDRSLFTATFLFEKLRVVRKQILGNKHTKLILEFQGLKFDALHFNSLEYYFSLENGDIIDLVAGLSVNNFRNRKKIQLMIKDVSCKDFQVLNFRESKTYDQDIAWVSNKFFEINDEIILKNNFKEFLTNHKSTEIMVITPRKTNTNLNKIVQKRELGKIYSLLKEIKEFKLEILLRRIEYDRIIFKFAIKIFIELNLVTLEGDIYTIKENALKTDLEKSKTYLEVLEKKKMIDLIYFDYLSHIKSFFKEIMEA